MAESPEVWCPGGASNSKTGNHGNAAKGLARSARLLSFDEDFLSKRCEELWAICFDGSGLRSELLFDNHLALQIRLLRKLLEYKGCPVRADLIERFARDKGKRIQFPKGYLLHLSKGRVLCDIVG